MTDMKKIIIVFYLCLLPAVLVYAQPTTDNICHINLEKICKILDLKIKCEAVERLYELSKRDAVLTITLQKDYSHYFEEITGVPLDSGYYKGITSVKDFVKQLNYPPSKAWQEYRDFIENIKSEKELCLKCIDAELAKGDSSEYANKKKSYYYYHSRSSFFWAPLSLVDYLKVFKKFILIDNENVLPSGFCVIAYLEKGEKPIVQ
jgi:hypothetical protein